MDTNTRNEREKPNDNFEQANEEKKKRVEIDPNE